MSADNAKCSGFVWVDIVKTKTRLGQHFLTDGASIERIVEAAQIEKEDLVVEIGPGRGALTGLLIEQSDRVVAIEVDRDLCDLLSDRFGSRLKIVSDDVRRVNLPALVGIEKREKRFWWAICHTILRVRSSGKLRMLEGFGNAL